ncbi:MAG: hypothetical protein ABIR06_09055 [Cyclobacteriaceae bacterium]
MKKLILIFMSVLAFSCGDGSNRSSEGTESETEDNYSNDAAESDTTEMRMDTTASHGMDHGGDVDTVSNNKQQ